MTMEIERQQDGRWHFALGVVERWVVGVVAAIAIGVVVLGFNSVKDQLSKQNDLIDDLVQKQAVTNVQMVQLQAQLADIPRMLRDMAELRVRVDRNTDDIHELRGKRGWE